MDVASLVFDIDSSQAVGAAKALAQMERAAASAATDVDALQKSSRDFYRNAKGQFTSASDAAEKNADSIRRLADEFNPALSAQLKFADAEKRLSHAVAAGVIPLSQKDAVLGRLVQQYNAAAVAQQRFGDSAQVATHHATNLSFQLNDIGMMMALGQNPFMLMMQQGPQVAQIFAQMNAEGRKIGPTLLDAFTSLINPTTAITLAVIGGAAAFSQWALSGNDAAQANTDFRDSFTELEGAVSSYGAALAAANQNSFALTAQFGAQADGLQRLYDLNVKLESIKLGQAIRDAATQANAAYGDLNTRLQRINDLIDYGARNEMVRVNALNEARAEMAALQNEYGLTLGQANALNGALAQMAAAKTMEDQALAAEAFGKALMDAHAQGATIPPELIRIASEAGVAAVAIREIAAASRDAAAAWQSVGTNTGTFITGYEPPPMPDAPAGGRRGGRSGGGGGGGGGPSPAEIIRDEMQQRWEALNEGFQSEYALAMVAYNRDLETLQWALDQKRITQQQYDTNLAMMRTTAWGTEWEQTNLQYQMDQEALNAALASKLISHEEYYRKLRELQFANLMSDANRSDMAQDLSNTARYFGMLQSMTGKNYNTLARMQQTFAAGAALVNAYLAASQALADPTLGFWGKMAAYGKVLAAGLGLAQAIKGAGGGANASGAGATATPATPQEPERTVLVNLQGEGWMVEMAEEMLTQIYEQSRDGRVIIARSN